MTSIFQDLFINQFLIGSSFVDTSRADLKGEVDEFRTWSYALTDKQIEANVATGPDVIDTEIGKVTIDVTKRPIRPITKS